MRKVFEKPQMVISVFNAEEITTTSAVTKAQDFFEKYTGADKPSKVYVLQ